MTASRLSEDPRRAHARILDTAEGVLIALRRCSLNQAFMEIMRTAKRGSVDPVTLADALLAIASGQLTSDLDENAVATARRAWGHLLGHEAPYGSAAFGPSAADGDVDRQGHG
jgi:hypothetical protein